MEIEKKFLVKRLPGSLEQYGKKQIEQGYLCQEPIVRIRRSNERYILTYKSRVADQAGTGMTDGKAGKEEVCINQEVELPLSRAGYEHLREKTDGNLITKCRYIIPLPDGHTGELDVFEGVLKGLVFIEVEFTDEADAASFEPPDWFGENVSGDRRYANSFLSGCPDLSAFPELIDR